MKKQLCGNACPQGRSLGGGACTCWLAASLSKAPTQQSLWEVQEAGLCCPGLLGQSLHIPYYESQE